MQIITLSVNHQLAPVDIREKVVFQKSDLAQYLTQLYNHNSISSCVILSTCNRSEIFITTTGDLTIVKDELIKWFASVHNIELDIIKEYLLTFINDEAITHISMVATGMDSLILGEPQILGQLKEAYQIAKDNKTLDKVMEKLFQHAFFVAKDVRTNTKIGISPVSVASCGVKLAGQIFTDLSQQQVLLIGANDMIELAAQHFLDKNIKQLTIANRTIAKAKDIADKYNAKAISLLQLGDYLANFDIIVSATSSPVPILGKGIIETALKQRKRSPIFILDIAVPRDVEPEVSQLEDIYLYTIDDLEQVIEQNISSRNKEKQLASSIINQKSKDFKLWLKMMPNEEIIIQYQQNANIIKEDLIAQALKKITKGDDSSIVIKTLADQLTNKLLHTTFNNIKNVEPANINQCYGCLPNNKK